MVSKHQYHLIHLRDNLLSYMTGLRFTLWKVILHHHHRQHFYISFTFLISVWSKRLLKLPRLSCVLNCSSPPLILSAWCSWSSQLLFSAVSFMRTGSNSYTNTDNWYFPILYIYLPLFQQHEQTTALLSLLLCFLLHNPALQEVRLLWHRKEQICD